MWISLRTLWQLPGEEFIYWTCGGSCSNIPFFFNSCPDLIMNGIWEYGIIEGIPVSLPPKKPRGKCKLRYQYICHISIKNLRVLMVCWAFIFSFSDLVSSMEPILLCSVIFCNAMKHTLCTLSVHMIVYLLVRAKWPKQSVQILQMDFHLREQ